MDGRLVGHLPNETDIYVLCDFLILYYAICMYIRNVQARIPDFATGADKERKAFYRKTEWNGIYNIGMYTYRHIILNPFWVLILTPNPRLFSKFDVTLV